MEVGHQRGDPGWCTRLAEADRRVGDTNTHTYSQKQKRTVRRRNVQSEAETYNQKQKHTVRSRNEGSKQNNSANKKRRHATDGSKEKKAAKSLDA
eukprot:53206-Chlamydomonas_euryale.AAC.1